MEEGLFLTSTHATSQRTAILDDDGRSAWLYLTLAGQQKPAAAAWLYNRIAAPAAFASPRGEQPVVPATHTAHVAPFAAPREDEIEFLWTGDGESIAMRVRGTVLAVIAGDRAMSALLTRAGPFGEPLAADVVRAVFEAWP